MGQITATRNLVATKVVRHAGQWADDVSCTISMSIGQRSRSHGSFEFLLSGVGGRYPSRSPIYNFSFLVIYVQCNLTSDCSYISWHSHHSACQQVSDRLVGCDWHGTVLSAQGGVTKPISSYDISPFFFSDLPKHLSYFTGVKSRWHVKCDLNSSFG